MFLHSRYIPPYGWQPLSTIDPSQPAPWGSNQMADANFISGFVCYKHLYDDAPGGKNQTFNSQEDCTSNDESTKILLTVEGTKQRLVPLLRSQPKQLPKMDL
ncbi:hypothetical protein Zmor_004103 [Zophobas morio]|jgi:hypothetical protein|uniref:Uncharacterized protein n=1 Tax=Zophobas morio TaxID=2755281 RepID=A0AA38M0I3_9CUCU|nr:hypothetical protein Zmor_004103 [Zophobas morio]